MTEYGMERIAKNIINIQLTETENRIALYCIYLPSIINM